MTYTRSYQGRRGKNQKDLNKNIHLRNGEEAAIQQLIRRQSLQKSRTVDYPILGSARYFTLEMKATLGANERSIKVSGPVSALQDEQIYKDLEALLEKLDELAER